MMSFIVADESVDYAVVTILRNNGYRVCAIVEEYPGWPDEKVLAFTFEQNAFLITEDKDFGELTYRLQRPNHGILLIRLPSLTGLDKAIQVLEVFQNHEARLMLAFSVLDGKRLRVKPYP